MEDVLSRRQDIEVPRRYSEFASLRNALVSLHPTLVIPPIPEKHSMADYAAKPTKAKEDKHVIDQRKRMLAVFLNRCRRMTDVMDDGVFWRFLDPNSSWVSLPIVLRVTANHGAERGAACSSCSFGAQEQSEITTSGSG